MFGEEDELEMVQTCGLCEMVVPTGDIATHSCLDGYSEYYVDSSTLYFYPMTDDGQNKIRRSLIGNESVLNTSDQHIKRNLPIISNIPQKKIKTCMSFDEEELLILEVQKREALWNFQLDVRQRSAKGNKKLWQEVSDALNGIISAETAKSKFKSLHDTYRKIIQSEQKASGSVRAHTTRLWQHYNTMEFLRDSCLVKTTASNISKNNTSEDLDQPLKVTANVRSSNRSDNLKKKVPSESAIDRIANAFCDTSNNDNFILPPPQPDDIDSFLNLLGSRIRRLSEVQKQEAFQKHLELSYDMLKENM